MFSYIQLVFVTTRVYLHAARQRSSSTLDELDTPAAMFPAAKMSYHAGFREAEGYTYNPGSQQQQSGAYGHQSRPQAAHRRVSCGSGLQSPPHEGQEEFDPTLATNELKSALFGSVKSQQQAHTAGLGNGLGITHTAAAASSGQLRQQVLQQLRAKQDKPAGMAGGSHSSIAAHHQKASEPFAGFVKGQDVRHNARLCNTPLFPKLAAEFSLHNNPLAEQHSERQVAGLKAASAQGQASAGVQRKQQLAHEASFEPVLSLAELASIDPLQL